MTEGTRPTTKPPTQLAPPPRRLDRRVMTERTGEPVLTADALYPIFKDLWKRGLLAIEGRTEEINALAEKYGAATPTQPVPSGLDLHDAILALPNPYSRDDQRGDAWAEGVIAAANEARRLTTWVERDPRPGEPVGPRYWTRLADIDNDWFAYNTTVDRADSEHPTASGDPLGATYPGQGGEDDWR